MAFEKFEKDKRENRSAGRGRESFRGNSCSFRERTEKKREGFREFEFTEERPQKKGFRDYEHKETKTRRSSFQNHERAEAKSRGNSFRNFEYADRKPQRDPELKLQREEEQTEAYILTGRNPIREALKNHRDLEKLLVQKGELSGSAKEIVQTAKEQKVMIQTVEKSRLDEIAPHHQGLIAFASAYPYSTIEEILETAKAKNEPPFLVLLDGITDPHNLGAIIRTANCAGAHGIVIPQHRSVGLTPAAVKASAGAVEYLKIAKAINLNRVIEDLQKQNIWVYALSMKGKDYRRIQYDGGVALVIGSEGDGISRLTEEKCDEVISLPIKGPMDSLNASVAAGIILYHVMSYRELE